MRPICILIVAVVSLVAFVVNTTAGDQRIARLQEDGTLIDHPEPSEKFTTSQLWKKLNGFDYYSKGDLASAKYVANLLYETNAKKDTEVIKGVKVAELIAQNEFKTLDLGCTKEAFRSRARVYLNIRVACIDRMSGECIGITVYVVKLLQMATYYCYLNKYEVVKEGINKKDFIYFLKEAYDNEAPSDYVNGKLIVEAVSKRYILDIAGFIMQDFSREEEDAKKKRNSQEKIEIQEERKKRIVPEAAARKEAATVRVKQKTGSKWWTKFSLSK